MSAIVIVGAGPAGLRAAEQLVQAAWPFGALLDSWV